MSAKKKLSAQQKAEARERRRRRRQQHIAELRERWAKSGPDKLLDEVGACLYVGGAKPIDTATLYRNYSDARAKVGSQAVRWLRDKLDAGMARMNADSERDSAA
jgi:hypothetical protein